MQNIFYNIYNVYFSRYIEMYLVLSGFFSLYMDTWVICVLCKIRENERNVIFYEKKASFQIIIDV